jgi:hypothetical protein
MYAVALICLFSMPTETELGHPAAELASLGASALAAVEDVQTFSYDYAQAGFSTVDNENGNGPRSLDAGYSYSLTNAFFLKAQLSYFPEQDAIPSAGVGASLGGGVHFSVTSRTDVVLGAAATVVEGAGDTESGFSYGLQLRHKILENIELNATQSFSEVGDIESDSLAFGALLQFTDDLALAADFVKGRSLESVGVGLRFSF